MWFYILAAMPFVMIALGASLAVIVVTVVMSQTKLPSEASGFDARPANI